MQNEVQGLVLRTVDIGESDRLITIYTRELGVVSALVKGGRSLKNKNMSQTQQFCYSSFVLYQRGDKHWVKESTLIESFFHLRDNIESLSLAGYIVEVLSFITTAEPEGELLRLALNSLYAIAEAKYSNEKIKCAFEMRAMAIIGFMPDVLTCRDCGGGTGDFFFNIMNGNIQCYACHEREVETGSDIPDEGERYIVRIISEAAKVALGYIVHAPLSRIFSFNIPEEDMHMLAGACEEYLLNQLERSFKSLDFYKEVKL